MKRVDVVINATLRVPDDMDEHELERELKKTCANRVPFESVTSVHLVYDHGTLRS